MSIFRSTSKALVCQYETLIAWGDPGACNGRKKECIVIHCVITASTEKVNQRFLAQ